MAGSSTVPRLPTKVPSPVKEKAKWYHWGIPVAIAVLFIVMIILFILFTQPKPKEPYEDDDEKKKENKG